MKFKKAIALGMATVMAMSLVACSKAETPQDTTTVADEATAISAGYRPCGKCMKEAYQKWKETVNK